jgi:hypothetical protein
LARTIFPVSVDDLGVERTRSLSSTSAAKTAWWPVAADSLPFIELRREVLAWVRETEALLTAVKMLVEWRGGATEANSFVEATKPARSLLRGMARTAVSGFKHHVQPEVVERHFQCASSTATIVSPLLEVLATPVPDFVAKARSELPPEGSKRLILGFALFCAAMSDCVYEPFWKDHPSLAPKEWPL